MIASAYQAAALLAHSGATALAQGGAWAVFLTGALLILAGAFGVILLRNPVHCALMLVVTLFGVAVEFVDQAADFLAAVQIIVYAGAVVIVFLFVIMLLGVDRREAAAKEPVKLQKPLAGVVAIALIAEILVLARMHSWTSGVPSYTGPLSGPVRVNGHLQHFTTAGPAGEDTRLLGQVIYTHYLLPFEMTAALLVIAVVAAVVLARRHEVTEVGASGQQRHGSVTDDDRDGSVPTAHQEEVTS